jgi:hypothetical protein
MEGDEGLLDAVEAFFDAGKSGDYKEAAQAFKDMCRLSEGSDGMEGEGEGEGEKKSEGAGGKPLSVLIGISKTKK